MAWMSLRSRSTSRIFLQRSSPRSASIPTPNTTCPACPRSTAWKIRRSPSATSWRDPMKLTLDHDHKLPAGVLGLAIAADGGRAFAACADGVLYEVDLASGKTEAFADAHQS